MTTPMRPSAADRPEDGIGLATHLFFLVLVATLVVFAGWAYLGRLDIVSVAHGQVTPASRIKSVQHLEGGIVREIVVRVGDKVRRGEPLITLEATSSEADVKELSLRLVSLEIETMRLEAEAKDSESPVFSDQLEAAHPELVRDALSLFQARRNTYLAERAAQQQLVKQRKNEIAEIRARLRNARASRKLLQEQIQISEELMAEKLTNRYNHLDLLRDASSLKSRIDEDAAGVERAVAAHAEAKQRFRKLGLAYKTEARQRLEQVVRERDELGERLRKFEDSLKRTVVRAPVDSVVKNIYVHTLGGVVRPGDTLVDLVPLDDKLIIQAQLPIQDIGHVKIGQTASVRLASVENVRFGSIDGEVMYISPDTLVRDDGLAYYEVHVETSMTVFERGNQRYQLVPGVRVVASIRTGTRTLLNYLLDPFLGSVGQALRER